MRAERVASRQSRPRNAVAKIVLLAAVLHGCVDPFADQTTTPTKVRGETSTVSNKPRGKSDDAKRSGAAGEAHDKGKEKQTYRQAWQLICEAEQRAGISPEESRSERGAAVASWIVNNVTNKQARYWFIEFGNAKPQHKLAIFLAEVKRVGIDPCPLTKLLFADDAEAAADGSAADADSSRDAGR